jgi:prophage antirepressor-like protein
LSAELVPFIFDGREVRIVTINGEAWFNVGDLCAILEIQNPRDVVAKNLRKEDVAKIYTLAADGKQRKVAFTNEPGVYRLILRSNKPDAGNFQDWICREVLPSIRKTGQFSLGIPMLAIQPTKWRKEFPQEFYQQLFRLKGKVMPEDLSTEPWLAQLTPNLIYQRLVENLWKALQIVNPVIGKWRRHKLHQYVAEGAPKEQLRAFIHECVGAMGSFMEWKAFYAHWESKYPIQRDLPDGASLNFADGQLLLPFEEVVLK